MKAMLGALLAATVLAVAACGGDDSGGSSSAAAKSGAPEKLTIAYQTIPNGDLVVKHQKWLERALPDTKIEWKLFDSGGTVNEAVAAGSVDIGLAGSSPVSRGLSDKLPYEVPWIHDVIGSAEALAVRDDIKSIEDLKGKTVATPLASTSHYSLLAALDQAGLSADDVKIIDAEPDDISAAWARGDIDGAYVWNPNLAKILDDGGHVLVDSAQLAEAGVQTYDLGVVTDELAQRYPDVVKTWVAQEDRAVKLYEDDPQEFAKAVGAELNLDPAEVLDQAKGLIFVPAADQVKSDYLGGTLAKTLFGTAEFNQGLGQIDAVQPEGTYGNAVTNEFVRQVAVG